LQAVENRLFGLTTNDIRNIARRFAENALPTPTAATANIHLAATDSRGFLQIPPEIFFRNPEPILAAPAI
jgi:hypothetical protein